MSVGPGEIVLFIVIVSIIMVLTFILLMVFTGGRNALFVLAFYTFIFAYCYSFIEKVILSFIRIPPNKHDNLALALYSLPWALLLLTSGIGGLWDFLHKRRTKSLCPHGIKNGRENGTCSACDTELRQRQIQQNREEEIHRINRECKTFAMAAKYKKEKYLYGKLDYLLSMDPRNFEYFVADLFSKQGFKNVHTTPASNDHGKDVVMWKEEEMYYVECKRYSKRNKVGRPEIQKFYGEVVSGKAKMGIFVTTSEFTEPAKLFANGKNLELIEGRTIMELAISSGLANIDDLDFQLMCPKCQNIVTFRLDENVLFKECPNGHLVENVNFTR
jgi:restriction system protein